MFNVEINFSELMRNISLTDDTTPEQLMSKPFQKIFFEIKIPKFVRYPKFQYGNGASTRIYNTKEFINTLNGQSLEAHDAKINLVMPGMNLEQAFTNYV